MLVDAPPQRAFELFTSRIGAWWPLDGFGVFNDGTVAFDGEQLIERSDGEATVWAEATEWDPPRSLTLAWHPGSDPGTATTIRVTFTAQSDETLVTLEHSGWDRTDDPDATAADYANNWASVLARYAELAAEVRH